MAFKNALSKVGCTSTFDPKTYYLVDYNQKHQYSHPFWMVTDDVTSCVCVCARACVCVCLHMRVSARARVCLGVYMHTYTHCFVLFFNKTLFINFYTNVWKSQPITDREAQGRNTQLIHSQCEINRCQSTTAGFTHKNISHTDINIKGLNVPLK